MAIIASIFFGILLSLLPLYSLDILAQEIVTIPGDQLQLQTTVLPYYLFQCSMTNNQSYQWQVRACAGGTCSDWAPGQQFTTSRAPEITSPFDSDWQSKEKARNAAPALSWCPTAGAVSYFLELYQKQGTAFNKVVLPERFFPPTTEYNDDMGWQAIKKATSYGWQIAACPGANTAKTGCGPFSQFWEFDTQIKLKVPINLEPPDGSAVNLSTTLSWRGDRYAAGYLLNIQGPGMNKEFPRLLFSDFSLDDIWSDWLALDTRYNWRAASCEGSATSTTGLICEDETTGSVKWSDTISFLTTGAPTANIGLEPFNSQGQVGLPLIISWDPVPGAASYNYEIPGIKSSVLRSPNLENPQITLFFEPPYLQQGQTYDVLIKTCADEAGLAFCGAPTAAQFTVAPLEAPTVSAENLFIPSIKAIASEVFGANAYQYQLLYTSTAPDETAECQAKIGSATESVARSAQNTIFARCAGQYELRVRGCIDDSCAESSGWGQWGGPLSLTIQEQGGGGLIPCGRGANDDATSWDERDPCGIKHIFLLIKILLDFLMFRLTPIALVLLTLYSGVIFYLALPTGAAEPLAKIKSLWKAAGIGLLITFFAWLAINTFLGFIGFNVGIFGNWYNI